MNTSTELKQRHSSVNIVIIIIVVKRRTTSSQLAVLSAQQVHTEQDRQTLLKAKYCPRAMPVQHFVNPGQYIRLQEHNRR